MVRKDREPGNEMASQRSYRPHRHDLRIDAQADSEQAQDRLLDRHPADPRQEDQRRQEPGNQRAHLGQRADLLFERWPAPTDAPDIAEEPYNAEGVQCEEPPPQGTVHYSGTRPVRSSLRAAAVGGHPAPPQLTLELIALLEGVGERGSVLMAGFAWRCWNLPLPLLGCQDSVVKACSRPARLAGVRTPL